jgi:hypothetical protein
MVIVEVPELPAETVRLVAPSVKVFLPVTVRVRVPLEDA